MSFIIRKMVPADIDAVLAIEALCFAVPWSKESMEYELTGNAAALYFVGIERIQRGVGQKDDEKIVAYAGLWMIAGEGHITNIAVHPDCRRQKKARLLVSKMMEEAQNCGVDCFTLEVKTTNHPAIALYEKFGFTPEGLRRGYYQEDHSDAYIMWKRNK